jgi:serine/threonine-protein kinase
MTEALAAVLGAELADRYRIEGEVGRGSAATVFLAQDLRHGRRVALKVLHSALGAALGVERFQREIRTQARLHHPHILTLFDSGAGGQRGGGAELLWYTMPYVESGSLRDRLRREGRLPVELAVQLAAQVCSALTYAHALGVVHRDVKPENILLSVSGHALLSDFGIAYAVDDGAVPGAARRLTETGVALGTPAYMSPEQSAGDEPVDARSDIYSLAGVLFEMLAGTPPFTGPNARTVIERRLTQPPPSVRALRPEVPSAVEAAIRRAMARQPGDRFESAAELAAALTGPAEVTPSEAKGAKRGFGRFASLRVTLVALAALAVIVAGVYAARRLRSEAVVAVPVATGPRMLAVLPFKNLGDSADQYFADGVTEEVTSRLAGLSDLRVISRTSTDQYRDSEKPLKEIASDLGAGYVLAGSVRYARDGAGAGRVRVTPQLVDVSDDSQLWTESFEVELGDIFRVQSQIAERVTAQLNVTLRGPERAALAGSGTRNPEAYDFYLRGNDYLGRSNQETDLTNAARLFEQAAAADAGFAVAYAKLARCHTQIYWHHYDHTTRRLTLARQALDSAARIGPELPETHMALGYWHYWARLDYESALREFGAALRLQPSNSELLQAMGYVERRRGRWEESLAHFVEALRYDPRSGTLSFDVGDNYLSLRMFGEADHYLERATALSSDWANPYLYRAWLHVIWRGDMTRARAIVGQGLNRIEAGRFALSLHTGDRVSASIVTADSTFWPMLDGLSLGNWGGDPARYHLLKAETAGFRGDRAAERAHGDSAITIIEGRSRAQPDDAKVLSALALAYSHAGRHRDAVRTGERSAELLPVAKDAVSGPFILSYLAQVYMVAGRHDDAVRILGDLIGIPSWISRPALRADPLWDPLRKHPGFSRLVDHSPST